MVAFENFVSNYWLLLVVVVALGGIGYRYIKSKIGKNINPVEEIINTIKEAFVGSTDIVKAITDAEQEGGREKAKGVIAEQLAAFIDGTDLLTYGEKAFIKSIDLGGLIDELEKELVNLKVLVEDAFNKKSDTAVADTSVPIVESTDTPVEVPEGTPVDNTTAPVTEPSTTDTAPSDGTKQ